MAGRKSKTATAEKPKATRKASPKTSAKAQVKVGVKRDADTSKTPKTQGKAVAKSKKKPIAHKPAELADVYRELARLAAYIDSARREIAAISPHDVKDEFLPSATDELDAIIEATAAATNTIMDSCELVEGVMGDVTDKVGETLVEATTRIYEACTFQDITGQRIGKVVTALKNIEDRIDALVLALGDELIAPKSNTKGTVPKPEAKKTLTDADLLEGPQLGAKAKSQAEIDDLLASFD